MFEAFGLEKVREAMLERGFGAVEERLQHNILSLQSNTASANKYHKHPLKYVTDHQPGSAHAELESFFRREICACSRASCCRKRRSATRPARTSRCGSDIVTEFGTQVPCFLNFLDSLTSTHIEQLLHER